MFFVLGDYREFPQEEEHDDQQVKVVSLEKPDEVGHDFALLHLLFDAEVLGEVQQDRERDVEHLVLLRDHKVEFLEFLVEVLRFLVERHELRVAQVEPVDMVLDDLHRRVADLVLNEQLMELLVVRVDEENAEKVDSEFRRLLELLLEHSTDCPVQRIFISIFF